MEAEEAKGEDLSSCCILLEYLGCLLATHFLQRSYGVLVSLLSKRLSVLPQCLHFVGMVGVAPLEEAVVGVQGAVAKPAA